MSMVDFVNLKAKDGYLVHTNLDMEILFVMYAFPF